MVHADRSDYYRYDKPIPLIPDNLLPEAIGSLQRKTFLWSRRLFDQIPVKELEDWGPFQVVPGLELQSGVGLTIVGHCIVQQPILYRSHLFLDTGEAPDGPGLSLLRVADVLQYSQAIRNCLANS